MYTVERWRRRGSGLAMVLALVACETTAAPSPQNRPATTAPESAREATAGAAAAILRLTGTHACLWRATEGLSCWGDNSVGQLGVLDMDAAVAHVETDPLQDLALGDALTCTCEVDGDVWCWGFRGWTGDSALPRRSGRWRVDLPPCARVFAGGRRACALSATHQLRCWGQSHEPGRPEAWSDVPRVIEVEPLRELELVGAWSDGGGHATGRNRGSACALTRDGRVLCWQDFPAGGPREVSVGFHPQGLVLGRRRGCVWRHDAVSCWRRAGGETASPVVPLSGSIAEVSMGFDRLAMRTHDGRAAIVGRPPEVWSGERAVPPVEFEVTQAATEIALSGDLGCVALRGGDVRCWGPTVEAEQAAEDAAWRLPPGPRAPGRSSSR